MEYQDKTKALNRLFADFTVINIDGRQYQIKRPNRDVIYSADTIYNQTYDSCKFSPWLSKQEVAVYLDFKSVLTNIDQSIKAITNRIKDAQAELYAAIVDPKTNKKLRRELELLRKKLNDIVVERHKYDYVTAEGYAEMVKNQYVIYRTTYYKGKRVWQHFDLVDNILVEEIFTELHALKLNTAQLREIARSEPWQGYWRAGRPNPFGRSAIDLLDEERDLISYSDLYDNALKSSDLPDTNIMEDDDLFDGWLVTTHRKIQSELRKDKLPVINDKISKAQEVFVMVNSPEEAQQVNDQNDLSTKILKKQREVAIKQRGELAEHQLPDKAMEIHNERMKRLKHD